MKKITNALEIKKVLVSDGAWGTFLHQKGLQPGECPELWNETHSEVVFDIAKSYVDSGVDMIETNSFGGNRLKLEMYDLGEKTFDLNKKSAEISRKAAGSDVFVLGSIGPTGKFLLTGDVTEEVLYDSFREQALAFQEGGADACCIETFYALDEAECAVRAVKENTDLEVICTFTFDRTSEDGFRTMMGVSPSQMAVTLKDAGVDIFGTNCGNGFADMIPIIEEIRSIDKNLPILIHANAGLPLMDNGKLIYPETPDFVARLVSKLVDAGANIIGGCCGTTPEHIKAISGTVKKLYRS